VQGLLTQRPHLVRRFAEQLGGRGRRMLLDVAEHKGVAARSAELADRIQHRVELLRLDQTTAWRRTIRRQLVGKRQDLRVSPAVTAPIESQADRGLVRVGLGTPSAGEPAGLAQFEEKRLHEILGDVLAQGQPQQQRVQPGP
jgi:hypothetical protein